MFAEGDYDLLGSPADERHALTSGWMQGTKNLPKMSWLHHEKKSTANVPAIGNYTLKTDSTGDIMVHSSPSGEPKRVTTHMRELVFCLSGTARTRFPNCPANGIAGQYAVTPVCDFKLDLAQEPPNGGKRGENPTILILHQLKYVSISRQLNLTFCYLG